MATARCGVLSVEYCFDPLLEGLEGLGFEDLEDKHYLQSEQHLELQLFFQLSFGP